MAKHKVIIGGGGIKFIYYDKMRPFLGLGKATVERASHVEPETIGGKVQWNADLSPAGGPTLGPYNERQEALDAEVAWLESNHLGRAKC